MAESGSHVQLSIAFCYCLVSSEVAARLGFHEAIGAVVAAYVFCKVPGLERNLGNVVSRFSGTFLTPLFFSYSGLQTSLVLSQRASYVGGWFYLFWIRFLGKLEVPIWEADYAG
jgi:Kef-type K+ transport system membrane component KefB